MSEQPIQPEVVKTYPIKHSAAFAGGTAASMAILDLLAHLGPTGLVVGGIASYVAWKHGPELLEQARTMFPSLGQPEPQPKTDQLGQPEAAEQPTTGNRTFWDRALGRYPDQAPNTPSTAAAPAQDITDDIFALEHVEQPLPCERLAMKDIIAHLPENGYRVYLGRSLTLEHNPARSTSIMRQHLKLIGASQKGKSSMAACILEQIIASHDIDHALIAILDLEDKTGRLFENDEHIVTFHIADGMSEKHIKMHARSKEQVLEYLGYIVQLMDYRYTFSEIEVEEMPLIVVYIEEFLALKDYYKRRISGMKDAKAKEQAQADYDALIYGISELARRGLKARIQLLLCAQVDYRDDDLYEALANITAGMSFCVKPSAAQAAGFTDAEMLKRNQKDNVVGQAVAEFASCKDMLLAPDYPLRQKLMAYEAKQARKFSPNGVRSLDASRDAWTPRLEPSRAQSQEVPDLDPAGGPRSNSEDEPEYTSNVRDFPRNGMNPPVEPLDPGPKEYRLTEAEIQAFIAAYKACGSIEKALSSINRGGWYKKHASEIVRAFNLRKDA